jgi:hypothetical protein
MHTITPYEIDLCSSSNFDTRSPHAAAANLSAITMKVFSFAIIALFSLLQQASAQSHERELNTITGTGEAGTATELNLTDTTPTPSDVTPFIKGTLDLPLMRDQLTITESSQNSSIVGKDIDATYAKMMQDFAATLDNYGTAATGRSESRSPNRLLNILIGFAVKVIVTLIVLKITFQLNEHRARLKQILPISLAIATMGALLNLIGGIGLFHPIQIALSFFLLLMMIRLVTDLREWAAALQMTFATRLASLATLWLTFTCMTLLFDL